MSRTPESAPQPRWPMRAERVYRTGRLAMNLAVLTMIVLFTLCANSNANEIQQALKNGNFGRAEKLIRGGADINAKGPRGDTALHWVAFHGNQKLLKLLLERGADVGARVRNGNTPLHLAAYAGQTSTAELLLESQARINSRNFEDLTPLHWAARNGHAQMIELLLAGGADPNLKDVHGRTALELASAAQHDAAFAVLRKGMVSAPKRAVGSATERPPASVDRVPSRESSIRPSGSLNRASNRETITPTAPVPDLRSADTQSTSSTKPATVPAAPPTAAVAAGSPQKPTAASAASKSSTRSMSWVQAGAGRVEKSAERLAQRVAERHVDLFGSVPVAVQPGKTSDGTTIYRVRAGPLPDDEARKLCEQLKSRQQDCFVARISK